MGPLKSIASSRMSLLLVLDYGSLANLFPLEPAPGPPKRGWQSKPNASRGLKPKTQIWWTQYIFVFVCESSFPESNMRTLTSD